MKDSTTNLNMTHGLADELKLATWAQHTQAEKSGVVASILQKRVQLKHYALYLRNLHHVYEGLEHSAQVPEKIRWFLDPKLNRSNAISSDLHHLVGSTWPQLELLDSAITYRARLNELTGVAHTSNVYSVALLGHIYVRYLGDINGGQVLQRLLSETLRLDERALTFYSYPEIPDLPQYLKRYRENLNALLVEEPERQSIVAEAVQGFTFNIDLSNAVSTYQYTK